MAGNDDAGIETVVILDLYYLANGRYPELTTTFTYAASCSQQWLEAYPEQSPGQYYSDSSHGSFYEACLPRPTWIFSPGICPSGHHIATIAELHDADINNQRLWAASCCPE